MILLPGLVIAISWLFCALGLVLSQRARRAGDEKRARVLQRAAWVSPIIGFLIGLVTTVVVSLQTNPEILRSETGRLSREAFSLIIFAFSWLGCGMLLLFAHKAQGEGAKRQVSALRLGAGTLLLGGTAIALLVGLS